MESADMRKYIQPGAKCMLQSAGQDIGGNCAYIVNTTRSQLFNRLSAIELGSDKTPVQKCFKP